MSPVSRGRKRKKGRARARRTESPFDVVLRQAPEIDSLLAAEMWASGVLGRFRWAALTSDDDPVEILDMAAGELLDKIEDNPGPAALATARAFSLVDEVASRQDFADVADALAAEGIGEPDWCSGPRELRAAYSTADEGRDVEVITLAYDDHVIGVICDHVGLYCIAHVMVVLPDDVDAVELAKQLGEPSWPEPKPISASDVMLRLTGPIDMFRDHGPADLDENGVAEETVMNIALLTARVYDLPEIAPDETDPIEDFLAGRHGDPELARAWALLATDAAPDYGREDTDFSVRFAEELLFNVVVPAVRVEDADLVPLTEVVTAWARFTGTDRPDELATLLEEFVRNYRAYDSPSDRVADLRHYRTEPALNDDLTESNRS